MHYATANRCGQWHAPGELIIREGDVGDAFFIIETGMAKVLKRSRETQELMLLGKLKARDYFGELALLENSPRKATIMADDGVPCVCLQLDRLDFNDILGPMAKMLRFRQWGAQGQGLAAKARYQPSEKYESFWAELDKELDVEESLDSDGSLAAAAATGGKGKPGVKGKTKGNGKDGKAPPPPPLGSPTGGTGNTKGKDKGKGKGKGGKDGKGTPPPPPPPGSPGSPAGSPRPGGAGSGVRPDTISWTWVQMQEAMTKAVARAAGGDEEAEFFAHGLLAMLRKQQRSGAAGEPKFRLKFTALFRAHEPLLRALYEAPVTFKPSKLPRFTQVHQGTAD